MADVKAKKKGGRYFNKTRKYGDLNPSRKKEVVKIKKETEKKE